MCFTASEQKALSIAKESIKKKSIFSAIFDCPFCETKFEASIFSLKPNFLFLEADAAVHIEDKHVKSKT